MHARSIQLAATFALAAGTPALGQYAVSPFDKDSWSENCGWMNWRDAGSPPASAGAFFHATYLSGFVWCENVGWLKLGTGTPANGIAYGNATAADFGVDLNPSTGALTGYAWGENVGWVNFAGGAEATPPSAARLDIPGARLRGYAWGENIGWINLNDANDFVGIACLADVDDGSGTGTPDGGVTIDDLLYYLAIFQAGSIASDVDDGSGTGTTDGGVTIDDLLYYLARFVSGC